jgi:hypothetical protein
VTSKWSLAGEKRKDQTVVLPVVLYGHETSSPTLREGEMSGACSTNLRRGTRIGYWWESQRERDQWEDQDVGWRWGDRMASVDWIGLAQGRDKWKSLVNAAMNLRVP